MERHNGSRVNSEGTHSVRANGGEYIIWGGGHGGKARGHLVEEHTVEEHMVGNTF
jgi:hypothetical protein